MIATTTKTIREHVIALLIAAGHSRIEAVDKWDDVYSRQYQQVKPGVTLTWVIGEYEFEFTKQGQSPVEIETVEPEKPSRTWVIWLILTLVILIALVALTVRVFEDGSFIALGRLITGCLPWGICNL